MAALAVQVVSPTEYHKQRVELLVKEKELTKARDALNAQRRTLPATRVEKEYTFTRLDATGKPEQVTLVDLFDGRPQLVIYHFMFDPEWDAGCSSCSLFADGIPNLRHLNSHNTTFTAVARAPIEKIEAYKKRMGWSFPWVSSNGSDFNYDFHVTQDENVAPVEYNFYNKEKLLERKMPWFAKGEQPGHSIFIAGGLGVGKAGEVFHTYSAYSRGNEGLVITPGWLDMTPLGRQDRVLGSEGLGYKRHDEYEEKDLKATDVRFA